MTCEQYESINTAWCHIAKGMKIAEKVKGMAESSDGLTSKAQTELQNLSTGMEDMEELHNKVAYLLKFKKDRDTKQAPTYQSAKLLLEACASQLLILKQTVNSLKTMLPKKKEE